MDIARTIFSLWSFRLFAAALFALPVVIVPFAAVPFVPLKMALAAGLLGAAVLLALIAALARGAVTLHLSWIVLSYWGIVLAYLVSTLFVPSPLTSLIGADLGPDTVFFVALSGLALALPLYIFEERADFLRAFFAVLASSWVVGAVHILRLIAGPDFLSFGMFVSPLFSLIGKWNDLGIFFGMIAALALITLEMLPMRAAYRWVLRGTLALALFFVALVNFTAVWIALGILAFGVVLHRAVLARAEGSRLTIAAGAVLALAVLMAFFSDTAGSWLSQNLGTSQIEARPSFESTMTVMRAVVAESPIIGSGPNTFLYGWDRYRPADLNASLFWNADFSSGVGFIPTSFATGGIIAAVAWLAFIGVYLMAGVRGLLISPPADLTAYYLMLASYVAGLYLLGMALVYLPSPILLLIGSAAIGMYAALYHRERGGASWSIVFAERPRIGLAAVFLLTIKFVVVTLLMGGVYVAFTSAVAYERAVAALQLPDGRDAALGHISDSLSQMETERAHRLGLIVQLAALNDVVSAATPETAASAQDAFRAHLGAAVEHGLAATRNDPRDYRNWLALGNAYASVVQLRVEGAYESARAAYERAAERNPVTPTIPFARAQLEIAQGDTADARPFLESSIQLKADFTPAILLLAQLELTEGNLAEAIRRAEAVALFEPTNPVLRFQIGVLKFEQKDYEGAEAAFRRALELAPEYANALFYLGRVQYVRGDTDAALASFQEVAQLNPGSPEASAIVEALKAGRDPFAPASGARTAN